jgi:hypothetical protein
MPDNCVKSSVKNINVNDSENLGFATSHFVIELLPIDYLSNQKQWKSAKKMHFKRNNSSHSCRAFSTVAVFCRSWHAEHFCRRSTKNCYIWKFPTTVWRVIPLEMHFLCWLSLLLVTQIINGKQLYYKMWSSKT